MTHTVTPAIDRRSFSCPHCGAHTGQKWFAAYAKPVRDGHPELYSQAHQKELITDLANFAGKDETLPPQALKLLAVGERRLSGQLLIAELPDSAYASHRLFNLSVSQCEICEAIVLWRYDAILYPPRRHEVEPNSDLAPAIQADFNEARTILDLSPRAAAALLRLCVQKLCVQLMLPGKNIDADIGTLVGRGLDPRVQKALDFVRVVGNNAVHPGELDLRDDRQTAAKMFELVNLIAFEMITRPRELDALYDTTVPDAQKQAIAKRDGT